MKKIIIITGLILLCSSVANAAGFLYGKKANEIYEEIEILQSDLGSLTAECESLAVLMQAEFRYDLMDSNFIELFSDYKRNKCLMEDVTSLEKALEEIIRLAPLSENVCSNNWKDTMCGAEQEKIFKKACKNDWSTYMVKSVANIRDEIYCLREYGEKKTEEKEQYIDIKCPKGSEKLATDFIQNYNDGNCKDKTWNTVFKKLTKSWNKLETKFSNIDISAKGIGENIGKTFTLDQDEEKAIDQAAEQNAQKWLEKNSISISTGSSEIGYTWSNKTPNQLKKNTEASTELTKDDVEKSFLFLKYKWEWAENSTIFSELEHLEDQEEFSKKLAESQTLINIHSELDQEFFNGLKDKNGIQGILDKLTNDLNDLSGKKPIEGKEKNNLITKKEGLELLLKKQDQ